MKRLVMGIPFILSLFSCSGALAAPLIKDADTQSWWATTGTLSGDDMEGRDTGSAGYARAAKIVAGRFKAAGLTPAGSNGDWFQTLTLREARVETDGTSVKVLREGAPSIDFKFLHEITVRATFDLPAELDAAMSFRGYCSSQDMDASVRGKVLVCFGNRRPGLPSAAQRIAAAAQAGAVGLVVVDDPGFTEEPARWPAAYARLIAPADAPPVAAPTLAVFSLSSPAFVKLLAGTGFDADAILSSGSTKADLPKFDVPGRFHAVLHQSRADLSSDNILGLLPGTDPLLKNEVVVVSAHLDGYGYGEPVAGDSLYNGAFDDAAYVSTLIQLAEQRHGRGFRRSVLFAVFTGEEKGLLGSAWFVRHPTVEKSKLVADINLDMVRPLFPLKALTMLGVDDTTLGRTAAELGKSMKIEIRPDHETDRGLMQRADHWSFLRAGVPGTSFLFAYDPRTEAERRFREWYNIRYHRPQDDMSQPIDFQAAAKFNQFFYRLTAAVADASVKPSILPTSPLKPKAP
jgi:Zn-dependent M28 family amino/carboxypeptidase